MAPLLPLVDGSEREELRQQIRQALSAADFDLLRESDLRTVLKTLIAAERTGFEFEEHDLQGINAVGEKFLAEVLESTNEAQALFELEYLSLLGESERFTGSTQHAVRRIEQLCDWAVNRPLTPTEPDALYEFAWSDRLALKVSDAFGHDCLSAGMEKRLQKALPLYQQIVEARLEQGDQLLLVALYDAGRMLRTTFPEQEMEWLTPLLNLRTEIQLTSKPWSLVVPELGDIAAELSDGEEAISFARGAGPFLSVYLRSADTSQQTVHFSTRYLAAYVGFILGADADYIDPDNALHSPSERTALAVLLGEPAEDQLEAAETGFVADLLLRVALEAGGQSSCRTASLIDFTTARLSDSNVELLARECNQVATGVPAVDVPDGVGGGNIFPPDIAIEAFLDCDRATIDEIAQSARESIDSSPNGPPWAATDLWLAASSLLVIEQDTCDVLWEPTE